MVYGKDEKKDRYTQGDKVKLYILPDKKRARKREAILAEVVHFTQDTDSPDDQFVIYKR